jgi:hypothetical protein
MSEKLKITILVAFIIIIAAYSTYWSYKAIKTISLFECLNDTSCYKNKESAGVLYRNPATGKIESYRSHLDRVVVTEFRRINKFYPMLGDDDDKMIPTVIVCCSLSLIGAVVFLLINTNFRRRRYKLSNVGSIILLGLLMGGVAFIVVQFAPSLLFKGEAEFKDGVIYAVALVAGMFSETFYNKISTFLNK